MTGNPLPEVIWSKKGQNLPYSDKYQYTYDSQSGHITLLIKDIGPGDEGQYSCTASNDYGSVTATLNLNPDVNSAGNSNAYKHEKPLSCFNSNTLRATLERNKKKNSTSPSIYSNGDMTLWAKKLTSILLEFLWKLCTYYLYCEKNPPSQRKCQKSRIKTKIMRFGHH